MKNSPPMPPAYPTMRRVNSTLLVSDEYVGGTPDFMVQRDQGGWFVKWRTSADWLGPYPTSKAAVQSIRDGLKGGN